MFRRDSQRPPTRKAGSLWSILFDLMKCQAYRELGTMGSNLLQALFILTCCLLDVHSIAGLVFH